MAKKMIATTIAVMGIGFISLFGVQEHTTSTANNENIGNSWRLDSQKGWVFQYPEVVVSPDSNS